MIFSALLCRSVAAVAVDTAVAADVVAICSSLFLFGGSLLFVWSFLGLFVWCVLRQRIKKKRVFTNTRKTQTSRQTANNNQTVKERQHIIEEYVHKTRLLETCGRRRLCCIDCCLLVAFCLWCVVVCFLLFTFPLTFNLSCCSWNSHWMFRQMVARC